LLKDRLTSNQKSEMRSFYTILFAIFITYSLHSQTYSNPAPITINDSSPANPFPSNINVTGATASITTLTVTLINMSHTWPSDVDIVLRSPAGTNFTIMSDMGGSADIVNTTIVLDDAAAQPVPVGFIASGSYRPTDAFADIYGTIPGPILYSAAAGTATFTTAFAGQNANGIWSLYVLDDAGGDIGSIQGGWSITFAVPIPGCTFETACNYNPLAGVDDGSCDYSCYGCTYSAATNYSPVAFIDDGSCEFQLVEPTPPGCTDPTACNYCNLCPEDDGSCDFSCQGCTYSNAFNFNPAATIDDGSCIYGGCTDPDAFNFNPIAQQDDGSCIYDNQCAADVNQDGVVGVADIIGIMTYFGNTCN
jgi:subtilisin-like proprotein convertase family protein